MARIASSLGPGVFMSDSLGRSGPLEQCKRASATSQLCWNARIIGRVSLLGRLILVFPRAQDTSERRVLTSRYSDTLVDAKV